MKKFCNNYKWYLSIKISISFSFILFCFLYDLLQDAYNGNLNKVILIACAIFLVIFLLSLIYSTFYLKMSGYILENDKIECFHGVFFKKHSILEYKKINAINIKSGLLQQIFNISALTIDSGSTNTATTAEVLIFLKRQDAKLLMQKLNDLKNGINEENIFETHKTDLTSFYNFNHKAKWLYSLINTVAALFVSLIAILFLYLLFLGSSFALSLILDVVKNEVIKNIIPITLTIFLLTFTLVTLFSIIGNIVLAFLAYYNYSVSIENNEVVVEYGLFVKTMDRYNINKIRAIRIKQNFFSRLFGYCSIYSEVIGLVTSDENNQNKKLGYGILVPLCKMSDVNEILSHIDKRLVLKEIEHKAKSFIPFISWPLIIFSTIYFIINLILSCFSFYQGLSVALIVLMTYILVIITTIIFRYLRYKVSGCSIDFENNNIILKKGTLSSETIILKANNLIGVEKSTTKWRKKNNIYSFIIHFFSNQATNTFKVNHLDKKLYDEILKLITF